MIQHQDPTLLEEMPQPVEELGAQCDKCFARALVICTLSSGNLYFCMHHYNDFSLVLTKQGAVAKLLTSVTS